MSIVNYQQVTQPRGTISEGIIQAGNRLGAKVDSFFCRWTGFGCGRSSAIAAPAMAQQQVQEGGNNKVILIAAAGVAALLFLNK